MKLGIGRALLAVVALAGIAACSPKIGFVDFDRVAAESEAGKAATAHTREFAQTKLAPVEAARAALAKAEAAKEAGLDQRRADLTQQDQQARSEIQQVIDRETHGLRLKMRLAATYVSNARGLDTITEGAPLYAKGDVTDEIIKRLADPLATADLEKERSELAALRTENAKLKASASPPTAGTKVASAK